MKKHNSYSSKLNDIHFVQLLQSKCINLSFQKASGLMLGYLLGLYPLERPLRWCDALEIYGIAHINFNHLVSYEIDMLSEKIIVYDSMSDSNDWPHTAGQLKQLGRFIPHLLKKAREVDPNFVIEVSVDEWPVVQCTDIIKQQTGPNECGIHAIKYIECLASGALVQSVDPDKCSKLRRYYCGQLYNAGVSKIGICKPGVSKVGISAALNM